MDEAPVSVNAMAQESSVLDRLLSTFGARIRPSRRAAEAYVLDEVVEIEVGVCEGSAGLLLRLPDGVELQRLGGVGLTDLDGAECLVAALDAIDRWAAGISDPGWSFQAGLDVDLLAGRLLEVGAGRLSLASQTFPPIGRTGQAYEALAVSVLAPPTPTPSDRRITVRLHGPCWDVPEADRWTAFTVDVGDGLALGDVSALERELERGAALLLPSGFRHAYDDAFARARDAAKAQSSPDSWGMLAPPENAGIVASDELVDAEGLDACVHEAFGARASEPVVVRAPRWITTTWSIDERFELAMGFDGELTRCGASVTLPNGVRTGSLFGRRIISTRHRSAVVGALGRVCNFIRLLGEGAPQRG